MTNYRAEMDISLASEDQLDRISAHFKSEQAHARKRTLWLALLPVGVGVLVVLSAWAALSVARAELARTEERRMEMSVEIASMERERAQLEKEIADRRALFEHFENKLPARERQEAQYMADGLQAMRRDDYPDAIRAYQQALKLDANNAAALNYKGYAHYKSGEYDRAVEDLRRATSLDPRIADAFYNLGFAYWKTGQENAAVEALEAAFNRDPGYEERARLDPEYRPIWSYRDRKAGEASAKTEDEAKLIEQGRQAARRRDYAKAISAYGSALQLNPQNAQVLSWRGYALYLDGQHKSAAETLQRAVSIAPAFAEGHYNLGLAHWALGDRGAAQAEFQKAFTLDPAWQKRARQDPYYQRIRKEMGAERELR